MVEFKPGVKCFGVRPEIVLAITIVEHIYAAAGYVTIITSLTEGRHSPGSLHYQGSAVDFRTRHIDSQEEKEDIRQKVQDALGTDFDVILEDTHLHVEFQPEGV